MAAFGLNGDARQRFLSDQGGMTARQFAFMLVGKSLKQQVGNDQPQHTISQKFEAFVGRQPIAAGTRHARMGQGLFAQRGVLESIA